ncbi:MAG: PIN domain-containing protein [Chromatiales bacterium]|nr:PIN domain-containing protein [Chromatiales bacterium]
MRVRAASRNCSMEEEARQILRAALLESPPPATDLATRIRARFAGLRRRRVADRRTRAGAPAAELQRRAASVTPGGVEAQSSRRAAIVSTLLDTNVLSELLRAQPHPAVLDWFAMQPADSLFVSAVTQAEMLLGARLCPAASGANNWNWRSTRCSARTLPGRVLPFDSAAAATYAAVVAARCGAGRPILQFDAQIAAIALSRRAALATRNVSDFEECGLTLTNPWSAR